MLKFDGGQSAMKQTLYKDNQMWRQDICICLLSTWGWWDYVNMTLERPCDAMWCVLALPCAVSMTNPCQILIEAHTIDWPMLNVSIVGLWTHIFALEVAVLPMEYIYKIRLRWRQWPVIMQYLWCFYGVMEVASEHMDLKPHRWTDKSWAGL